MNVRDVDPSAAEDREVCSIDLWFSSRRKLWIVERFDSAGDVIGPVHLCAEEEDARDCLQHWMRAHAEAQAAFHEDAGLPPLNTSRQRAA